MLFTFRQIQIQGLIFTDSILCAFHHIGTNYFRMEQKGAKGRERRAEFRVQSPPDRTGRFRVQSLEHAWGQTGSGFKV